MIKAIPVIAVLAIAVAVPALAQQQYPSDNSTTTSQPRSRDYDQDQQARRPEASGESSGTVETLRDRGMSAPNVKGDAVPANPNTGVPEPEGRGDPKRLESVPRP